MKTMSREEMWKQTVADMQSEIHALQKTVVKLQEQLTQLQRRVNPYIVRVRTNVLILHDG